MKRLNHEGVPVIDAVIATLVTRRSALDDLLAEMVGINSQIPPHGDERQIAQFLAAAAAELGLPAGEILALDTERPNLVIRIPGSGGGSRLILNGHIDTKPVGDAAALWHTDPLVATRVGDKIYGLGISDMKGAVACMLHAVAAIISCGVDLRGDVILALVADEEAGASFGSRYIAPLLSGQADACLIGEPSGWQYDWQGIHVVSRGLSGFQVRVSGTQMHSSLSDRMPSVNANLEMAKLILRLQNDFPIRAQQHPLGALTPTLNVAVTAAGGVFYGVVPGEASFGCDLRTVPGIGEADVRTWLDKWAADRTSGSPADVRIEYDEVLRWIPSAQIAPSHPLVVAAVDATAAVLGEAPPLTMFPGTTDAPWFEAAGIPTLPSLGPGILTYCHGPNEFVRAESIHEASQIYARIVLGYCGIAGA